MVEAAIFIFRRRHDRCLCRQIWKGIEAAIEAEGALAEKEAVLFLWDAFNTAMEKVLKLQKGAMVRNTHLKRNGKTFIALQKLVPWVEEAKINPFAFFIWAISQRRQSGIPPTVTNICSKNTLSHFVAYLGKNRHRVATYARFTEHEQQLHNQFEIDLMTLVTYQLRKARVSLGQADYRMFSHPVRVLLSLHGFPVVLDEEDTRFAEDLQFDPEFQDRLIRKWKQMVRIQLERVTALPNRHSLPTFQEKVESLIGMLNALSFNATYQTSQC